MKMAGSSELQTLVQVSSEIDESEVKITFANQCIKAQQALSEKLKEEIHRRKEACNSKKNENLRLEAEIKNAELEIENLRITHRAMVAANTEKNRELLMTKEKRNDITERIKKGEKKYEDLWIEFKKRYESIPLVKKLMQGRNTAGELENDATVLQNETQRLQKASNIKKEVLAEKDRKQIIQLAKFYVQEMPATVKAVEAKTAEVNKLTKEIEEIAKGQEDAMKAKVVSSVKSVKADTELKIKDAILDNHLMIPKLQLPKVEIDITSVRLDLNKVTLHTTPVKRTISITELDKNATKRPKVDDSMKNNYMSTYFNKMVPTNDDKKDEEPAVNYSHRKLINILEDLKIDDNETYKIVAKADIHEFQEIDVIVANKDVKESAKHLAKPLESDEIEVIDLTSTHSQEVLIPPTQFSDFAQQNNNENEIILQEDGVVIHRAAEVPSDHTDFLQSKTCNQKKVSFNLPMEQQDAPGENIISEDVQKDEPETPNATITSELDLSAVNDDNFMAIKDMILKKHHLDLSPQFVYARNSMFQRTDSTNKTVDKIVTSKFFDSANEKRPQVDDNKLTNEKKVISEDQKKNENHNSVHDGPVAEADYDQVEDNSVSMDADFNDNAVLSPKATSADKPVTGLLFSHGPQGIPDCLDISMSTTGYDEGDQDFMTCLDSSILLSPKADLPMPMSGGNSEVTSQDMPNFLSGFRKTGLSFFKQNSSEANPDSSKENQENNFSFNFRTDDKKSRGGLFSFFR